MSHVTQIDLALRTATDQHITEIGHRVDAPTRLNTDEVRTDFYTTRIADKVLLAQFIRNGRGSDSKLGDPIPRELYVNGFLPLAVGLDLGHVLNEDQLLAKQIGYFLDLCVRILASVYGNKYAVNVPVVIYHQGWACAWRQGRLGVIHLAT